MTASIIGGASSTTAPGPKPRVYLWERPRPAPDKLPQAIEVLGPGTAGFKKGWQIADRAIGFSADGLKLSVATGPDKTASEPEPKREPNAPPATERNPVSNDPEAVNLDLWSWKDEAIQPMQKVRAAVDRSKTFTAVYLLDTKEFKQLQDDAYDEAQF